MEKGRMAYLVLKNLYNGNILSQQELGINKNEYAEILNQMQEKNLISGVKIANLGQKTLQINTQKEEITVTGVDYLMENTIPDHEYKMQASINVVDDGIELSTIVDVNGRTCKYKEILHKPLADIDIETESFILAAEGLKKENRKHCLSPSN